MIQIQDWGLIDFDEAWTRQMELVRQAQENPKNNFLVVCQHPTVLTIGRKGTSENVVVSPEFLKTMGVKVVEIDRGGDVTMHNPGQLIGYPIFNLTNYKQDLHWFLREIESVIIELLDSFSISSGRVEGLTGVWIEETRKICAIGLHCSRWVISHGFALNVNNKLDEFNYIIPCGITDKEVTSIEKELGIEIAFDKVKDKCINIFEKRF